MNQFGTKRVCGKADATPFLNATRPNVNNDCPDGNYRVCSTATSADNTICYDTESPDGADKCPITDVLFVENDLLDNYI